MFKGKCNNDKENILINNCKGGGPALVVTYGRRLMIRFSNCKEKQCLLLLKEKPIFTFADSANLRFYFFLTTAFHGLDSEIQTGAGNYLDR